MSVQFEFQFNPYSVMDPSFEIKEITAIRHGKFTWIPKLQEVDGCKFIELSKWDRDFVRFATGKSLDFRSGKACSANVSFFDRLIAERKKSTHDAIVLTLQEADDEGSVGRNKRRKTNWQEVLSSEVMAPRCSSVELDGACLRALAALKSTTVWVELNASNLSFIQNGVAQCLCTRDAGRHWRRADRDEPVSSPHAEHEG